MVQLLNNIPNSRARRAELQYRLKRLERLERIQMLCLALDDPYPPLRHDVAEAFQSELHSRSDDDGSLEENLVEFLHCLVSLREPPTEVLKALTLPRDLVPRDSLRARVAACVALEASPWPERTTDVIRPLLDLDEADLRYQAVIAIHRLLPGSALLHDVVVDALGDEDPEIAVVATQVAVKESWEDLLPAFLHARARLHGEDRIQVTFSVGGLLDNSTLTPADLPREARGDMIIECVDALRHEPHTAAAIKTLARLRATEAADELVGVTKRWFAHPILKVEAAAALVDLDHPRGEEYLERSLSSRRKDARGYALRIIGKRRLERFFPELVRVATGTGYHADTATLALADYDGPEARRLLDELSQSHADAEVRRLAGRALLRLPDIDPASFDATLDR